MTEKSSAGSLGIKAARDYNLTIIPLAYQKAAGTVDAVKERR